MKLGTSQMKNLSLRKRFLSSESLSAHLPGETDGQGHTSNCLFRPNLTSGPEDGLGEVWVGVRSATVLLGKPKYFWGVLSLIDKII